MLGIKFVLAAFGFWYLGHVTAHQGEWAANSTTELLWHTASGVSFLVGIGTFFFGIFLCY